MAGEDTAAALAASSKECSWYDVPCVADAFGDWLYDAALFLPRKVWSMILDGLATVVESIPVPDFVSQAHIGLASMSSTVVWLTDWAALPQGVGFVLSAYALRFALRRIPLIG